MKCMKKIKDKKIRLLRYIIIGLICIVAIELIYMTYKLIDIRKNSTYYSAINSVIKVDDKYVAVGLSDAKHSKLTKYKQPGYNKPYIWVYDKNFKIIKEVKLDIGYNGEYKDIIKVDDGYIAVGSIEMSEKNHEDNANEGIIVKYDENFNYIWRKNYNPLGNTKFNVVKILNNDTLLVAGSSVYESNVIGNHTTGGAIIAFYTLDGELGLEIQHGGPRTGEFNDIEIVEDGIIAVGIKSSGTGIMFKYNFKGKEIWHNYYGYTDGAGLTSITKITDDEYVITGSILEDKNNTDNYQASLIKINDKGKIIQKENYQKQEITRFEDSVLINDKLYVIGLFGKKENDVLNNDSIVITYNSDLEKLAEKEYAFNNTYTLNKIINDNNKYLVVGHTNSKINNGILKTNGLDFYSIITY